MEQKDQSFSEISLLCIGTYSTLYKAKRYGQWFVLKCLKKEFSSQAVYRELLRKEFEIGISLTHPNIVRILGWEKIKPVGHCIVMEYIDGITFRQFLEIEHSSSEKKRIIKEILSALSYIHGKQIVHRDLKLSNIMVTHNGGNAKLIDFGLSDTDSYSILKQPVGTNGYTSPEQLSIPVTDGRNDIFSLGVILKKARISLFYNYIGWKCTQKESARFANIERIIRLIQFWEKFCARITTVSILLIMTLTISRCFADTKRTDGVYFDQIIKYISNKNNQMDQSKTSTPKRNKMDHTPQKNSFYVCTEIQNQQ